ncbi:MAG TPA: hypothetical protein EYH31_01700, partial [Anaerolineae bacterium]|nr:hypothetical protein [Anaerolineae bacterium]
MRKSRFTIPAMLLVIMLLAACQIPAPTAAPGPAAPEATTPPKEEAPAGPRTLTVSTWGYNMDLINKNITEPFEKKYNVKIVYET